MKRRLFVLLHLSLTSLLVVSFGLSIAWFGSADFLRVQYFTFELSTGDELEIATKDDEDFYKEHLTLEDLDDLDDFGYLVPVSAMYSSRWLNEKPSYPSFYSSYTMGASTIKRDGDVTYISPIEEIATTGYYSREFFLRSPSDHFAVVDASSDHTYIVSDEEANEVTAKRLHNENPARGSVEEIAQQLNDVVKSLRFSILSDTPSHYDYKIFDPYKEGTTYYGGVLDSTYSGTYDTRVDPVSGNKYEIVYGEVENREKIKYSFNEEKGFLENPNCFTSSHDENTYTFDEEASISNGLHIVEETSLSLVENEVIRNAIIQGSTRWDQSKMFYVPVLRNVPARIVVTFYLEGWDKDNIDYTMGASFKAKIGFGLVDKNSIKE